MMTIIEALSSLNPYTPQVEMGAPLVLRKSQRPLDTSALQQNPLRPFVEVFLPSNLQVIQRLQQSHIPPIHTPDLLLLTLRTLLNLFLPILLHKQLQHDPMDRLDGLSSWRS